MKHLHFSPFLTAILLITISCNKEPDYSVNSDNTDVNGTEDSFEIVGTITDPELTKTQYTESNGVYSFSWTAGDYIRLLVYKGNNTAVNYYTMRANSTSQSSTFYNKGNSVIYDPIGNLPTTNSYSQTGFALYPINDGAGSYPSDYLTFSGTSNSDGTSCPVKVTLSSSYTLTGTDMVTQLKCTPLVGVRVGDTNNYNFSTAVGILMITLDELPTSANRILLTSPSDDAPLSGTFNLESGKPDIAMANKDSGNLTRTVNFTITESDSYTFYIPLPVGTIPVDESGKGLRIELQSVDEETVTNIFSRSYTKSLTIKRNRITPVTLNASWKKLGKGKFVDNFIWGLLGVDTDYIDVNIEQNISNPNRYRIHKPYGMLEQSVQVQSSCGEYLYFTIDPETGAVSFEEYLTGFSGPNGVLSLKLAGEKSKLIDGSSNNPRIVSISPDFYVGANRDYTRNDIPGVIKIIFPNVNDIDASFTLSGNARFDSGATFSRGSNTSSIKLYMCNNSYQNRIFKRDGILNDGGVDVSSRMTNSPTSPISRAGFGMDTYISSGTTYLIWTTHNSSGDILMQGHVTFYFLSGDDYSTYIGSYLTTADIDHLDGTSKNLVIATSNDLTKGNVMITGVLNQTYENKPVYGVMNGSTLYFFKSSDADYFKYKNYNYWYLGQSSSNPGDGNSVAIEGLSFTAATGETTTLTMDSGKYLHYYYHYHGTGGNDFQWTHSSQEGALVFTQQ